LKTYQIYLIIKSLIIGILICLEPKLTSLPRTTKFDVKKLSANKREGSELDLSGQELTDQDIIVVIQYAFENSTVSMQSAMLS
jgi:hypothetical protein